MKLLELLGEDSRVLREHEKYPMLIDIIGQDKLYTVLEFYISKEKYINKEMLIEEYNKNHDFEHSSGLEDFWHDISGITHSCSLQGGEKINGRSFLWECALLDAKVCGGTQKQIISLLKEVARRWIRE